MKLAKDGSWDGSAVWSESEERLQNFFFSDPVVNSSWVFFHLKSYDFDWSDYEDLTGVRVGGTVEYYYSDESAPNRYPTVSAPMYRATFTSPMSNTMPCS